MRSEELRSILSDCCHDITFSCNGVLCGVTSEVRNYIPEWQAWYGREIKTYSKVDDLLKDPFFGGFSLNDLSETIFLSH